MALVDGGDEGRFDGDEGCHLEVFGEFAFGGFIADNAFGLACIVMC